MTTFTKPPEYTTAKLGMEAGMSYACEVCGKIVTLPADNKLPEGAEMYRHGDDFIVFCSEHAGTQNVMQVGRKDLYESGRYGVAEFIAGVFVVILSTACVLWVLHLGVW